MIIISKFSLLIVISKSIWSHQPLAVFAVQLKTVHPPNENWYET